MPVNIVNVWTGDWSRGWSSIVPLLWVPPDLVPPYILEYKTGDGTVAIDQIKPGGKGTTEVYRGGWTRGWSSIVPFQMGNEQYILEYKTGDGTVAIDQIKPGGKGTTEVYRATGSKGWSSLVPVGIGQVGSQYMVKYDTDNGTVAIDQISPP